MLGFADQNQSKKVFLGQGSISEVVCQKSSWRVRFQGSYWFARSAYSVHLNPGEAVRVVGMDNITLLIEPFSFIESKSEPPL